MNNYNTTAPRGAFVDTLAQFGLRNVLLVAAGVCVLTASAKVQVPFFGVPMTLQMLAVLTLAALYGFKLGMANILTYTGLGAIGLPVFAHPAGLYGPTSGYIVGFVIATAIVGYMASAEARGLAALVTRFAIMAFGAVIIYALGVPVLASFIGMEKAIEFGVIPFLAKDTLCVLLAALIAQGLWQFTPKQ